MLFDAQIWTDMSPPRRAFVVPLLVPRARPRHICYGNTDRTCHGISLKDM